MEGFCDEREGLVAQALREFLNLGLLDLAFEVVGWTVFGLGFDLLLEACVCDFAKATPLEVRF